MAKNSKRQAQGLPKEREQGQEKSVAGQSFYPRANLSGYFALVAGAFLALALVKWGNPVILEYKSTAPEGFFEYFYFSWPLNWSYFLLLPLAVFAIISAIGSTSTVSREKNKNISHFLNWVILSFPLCWALWQMVSANRTVDGFLTSLTLPHLCICALLFYLGFFGLKGEKNPWALWAMLTLGLFWLIKTGFGQHFGGLEEYRRWFQQQPGWENAPPGLIKRYMSNRIFATFGGYPNSLAGALLLLLPVSLAALWKLGERFSRKIQIALVAAFGIAGFACLYWSGSKAGWLLTVVVLMIVLWRAPFGGAFAKWKLWLICMLLALGLAGFFVKNREYFKKGGTSVVARFDYWEAAVKTIKKHPLIGSGPGTFYVQYESLKSPDSEPAKLCHNDYLQQASDSGIPGFFFFTAFMVLSLVKSYRSGFEQDGQFDLNKFAVWLGVFGLALHSLVEFHLYVPALAWTQFFLLGWLWRQAPRSA